MNAADPTRAHAHRWHAPEKGSGPAFALSLLAHAVLFIAIAFMVRWKSEAGRHLSRPNCGRLPPAAVVSNRRRLHDRCPLKSPPPPPTRAAQGRHRDRAEESAPPPKVEPQKVEEKKVEPPDPPKKNDTKAIEGRRLEIEGRRSSKRRARQRVEAAMARAQAQAGPQVNRGRRWTVECLSRRRSSAAFARTSFSMCRTRSRPQQYVAEFEVMLLPTGEQAALPKLLKASGLAAYDQAVERAIRRCDPFPPPKEGTMPRSVRLSFDPVEMR